MGNAARKARKREANELRAIGFTSESIKPLTFSKQPKVGTPILERSTKPVMRADIVERGTESRRFKKKLVNQFMVSDEAQRRSDAWSEAYAAEHEVIKDSDLLELDPKPYRVGRKRYDIVDARSILYPPYDPNIMPSEVIFSPRSKYEQDAQHYPL